MEKEQTIFKYSGWLIIGLPLLIILGGYYSALLDPALHSKFFLLAVFLVGFSILLIFNWKLLNAGILREKIFLWYALYVLILTISLGSTINFADGLFDVLKIALFLSLLAGFSVWFRTDGKLNSLLVNGISIFALIASLIGVCQLAGILMTGKLDHLSTYLISATFAHRNLYAEVLFLTLPFTLYGIFRDNKVWKYICIAASLITFFLIIVLLVRAVWFALIFGSLVTVTVYLFNNGGKNVENSGLGSLKKYRFLLLAAVGTAVFIYFKQGSLQVFEKQGASVMDASYGSAKDRKDLWTRSFTLIKEKPLMGWGVGSWKIQTLRNSVKGTQMQDAVTFFQNPHNDFIWVFTEGGILALVFYLLVFFTAFYYLFIILKKDNGKEKLFYYFLFGGLAGYLVCASLSFPRDRIEENLLLVFIFLPIVVKYHSLQDRKPFSSAVFYILVPVSIFIVYVGWQRLQSEKHTLDAFKAKSAQQWESVIEDVNLAESPWYKMDPISTPLRWHSGLAYFNLGKKDEAYAEFMKAYTINPYHVHVLNNIGTCMEEMGKHDEAIAWYRKALVVNPVFEDALLNLATVHFNLGQVDTAAADVARIPGDFSDPKVRQYILVIVPAKVKQMIGFGWPKEHEAYFEKVAASPERCLRTFTLARDYPQSLRRQLEMEARDSTKIINY